MCLAISEMKRLVKETACSIQMNTVVPNNWKNVHRVIPIQKSAGGKIV